MSFNESQKLAVDYFKGPLLVLAGPGSGKTTVITYRTKKLIEENKIDPSNILVITFTKAAAVEMQERFDKITEGKKYRVNFGTFHAIYFRILKYAYNYKAENIISEDKKFLIIKEIITDLRLDIEDTFDFINGIIGEISYVKGEMLNILHYYSKNCAEEIFKKIYEKYNEKLISMNLIDFDDMLLMCYELLTKREDILKLWQDKFRYILIDEFQDINKVQYEVIKLLAKPNNNLFIVGDDDQSIYSFRGAKPEIMLSIEKEYKDVKKIVLDYNYRSKKKIIELSENLIKNNKKRFDKNIKAVNLENGNFYIKEFADNFKQTNEVIDIINNHLKNGGEYKDIAVLYRTNTNPRILVERLMEYNIPFKMKDNLPNIYEHFISKNIISYIRVALGSRKRSDILEIINRPKRYISREVFNKTEVDFFEIKKQYFDKDYIIDKLEKLEYDLKMLKEMSPYAAISYIRHGIGYEEYLEEYAKYRRIKPEEYYEILDELMQSSKPYKTYDEWFLHIEEYATELKNQYLLRIDKRDGVELLTMHSSKGLEYNKVIIIDVNEGIVPHKKALLPEDIEEERRMFYVALTRARDEVYLFYCKERFGKEQEVSRFAKELFAKSNEYKKDDIIFHTKYGKGIIKKVTDDKFYIEFEKDKKELIFDKKIVVLKGIIRKYEGN